MPLPHARVTRNTCLVLGFLFTAVSVVELPAFAATPGPGLGSATSYALLATSTITNTGPSEIVGDVGLSPGTSITGFTGATVVGGEQVATAAAATAVSDAQAGYDNAASRAATGTVTADLAGQALDAGVYDGATLSLSGTLTLDGQGSADSVFILRSASTLVTATASSIVLINGAQACKY